MSETSGNFRAVEAEGHYSKSYLILDNLTFDIRVHRVTANSDGTSTLTPIGVVATHTEADELVQADAKLRNLWGTLKEHVGEDFCQECERDLPFHYAACPTSPIG